MNEFQASTQQRELQSNKQESLENTNLVEPISDASEKTEQCEKRRHLLDEIEKLKTYRDNHLSEAEKLYTEMSPLEALLEGDEVMDDDREIEIRKQYNQLKIPYDSRQLHVSIFSNQIARREKLVNRIRPGIPPCATSEDQGQPIPHLYQCCASPFEIALTPRFLNTSYAAIKSDSSLISGQDPKG